MDIEIVSGVLGVLAVLCVIDLATHLFDKKFDDYMEQHEN